MIPALLQAALASKGRRFRYFLETAVVRTGGPLFMKLWGIPFMVIGIYIIARRFLFDAYRGQTWYGVTTGTKLVRWT